ncbi:uncharacterized protein RAG0_03460 [Rhynchosporium agropyri]|uniref:Uncharacterized protein n=1 Tax=Rhynchosporium agropyri TaxID=914238 RepID=A0A1E1K8N8_9HELO|nr:uncharacterized protein RAG0_03460 [Rhynchosporium agropyri]
MAIIDLNRLLFKHEEENASRIRLCFATVLPVRGNVLFVLEQETIEIDSGQARFQSIVNAVKRLVARQGFGGGSSIAA